MKLEDALDIMIEILESELSYLALNVQRVNPLDTRIADAFETLLRCADEEWQRREMPHTKYLTLAELEKLPEGTPLMITWNGGNGPGRFFLHKENRWGYDQLYAKSAFDRENPDSQAYYSLELKYVGPPENGKHFRDAVSLWDEGG